MTNNSHTCFFDLSFVAFTFLRATVVSGRAPCNLRTSETDRYRKEHCIVPFLGEYELHDLTLHILQQFVTDLLNPSEGKPLSANTVNGIISVVQNSLKTAFTLGYVEVYDANKICRSRTVEKKVECSRSRSKSK